MVHYSGNRDTNKKTQRLGHMDPGLLLHSGLKLFLAEALEFFWLPVNFWLMKKKTIYILADLKIADLNFLVVKHILYLI